MADQLSSNGLSPQLQAVLSSLNINLEAELDRYRRNRFTEGSTDDDLLTDLNEAAFDTEISEPTAIAPPAPQAHLPPPVPRNKKLFPHEPAVPVASVAQLKSDEDAKANTVDTADSASAHLAPVNSMLQVGPPAAMPGLASSLTKSPAAFPEAKQTGETPGAITSNRSPNSYLESNRLESGYLASSEKLIESLKEVPPMPKPASPMLEPKRKTRSLLAGAMLGSLGLVAGLGASYLMSNPLVAQRLANSFSRGSAVSPDDDASKPFDPPGPDLSAREFIDIDIDNLSSLKMPQTTIDPANNSAATVAPTSSVALPPISAPVAVAATSSTDPAAASLPTTETPVATIPAATNYYITVPFSTEQGLIEIRQTVNEAFVRQFTDGVNRIQLAAFENLDFAEQFIDDLKQKGITAQVYGPTPE